MTKKYLASFLIILMIVLTACAGAAGPDTSDPGQAGSRPTGMGPGSGMMDRHHAGVPADYAGLTNPVTADEASLARGAATYAAQCATCHGDFGNGDGPAGAALDPAPAPIAHTSQMMSDAYLFWRITVGGVPFETSMVAYGDILDEDTRWDVINYVRALGRGDVEPGSKLGGQPFDPAQEAAHRAEMLAQALEQAVITQAEADLFDQAHAEIDAFTLAEGIAGMQSGERGDVIPEILEALVADGSLEQDQADQFLDIHDRLIDAGLMQ